MAGLPHPLARSPVAHRTAARFLRHLASRARGTRGGRRPVPTGSGGDPEVTMVVHDPRSTGAPLRQGSVGSAVTTPTAGGMPTTSPPGPGASTAALRSGDRRPGPGRPGASGRLAGWVRRLRPPSRSADRHNIRSHYDLSNEFFALMLDETMMYSCGVLRRARTCARRGPAGQARPAVHQAGLGPDDHVVEIGTGWGGFACHAAARHGCRVTTTTISDAQFEYASKRVVDEGLADRVTVLDADYRDLTGTYDKLVSIEMVEAVDWRQHDTFFADLRRAAARRGADGAPGDHRGRPQLRAGEERHATSSARVHLPRRVPPLGRGDRRSVRRATPCGGGRGGHRPPLRRDAAPVATRTSPGGPTRSPLSASTPGSVACGTSTSATARGHSSSGTSATYRWSWPCPTGRRRWRSATQCHPAG